MATAYQSTESVVAVDDFFCIAAKLYDVGSTIHEDQLSFMEVDLAQLANAVDANVATLNTISVDGVNPDHVLFVRSCAKVGADLRIRVSRLQHVAHADNNGSIAQLDTGACLVWHRDDVDALGSRLDDMSSKWDELCSSSVAARTLTRNFSKRAFRPLKDVSDPAQPPGDFHRKQQIGLEEQTQRQATISKMTEKIGAEIMAEVIALRPKAVRSYASPGLLQDFILDSLAYKSMADREQEVTEAHTNTFEWIFNPKGPKAGIATDFGAHFTTWLATDDMGSIYWISGKPGSGKSTLMRYLCESNSTMTFLHSWAGSDPICKAGFFFWTSGSREQRSLTGLLRYLLHQLLSENRELIPKAFPDLWERLGAMTTKERIKLVLEWSSAELIASFSAFMAAALPEMKICLFIDGLDEFDGNHVEIINFFRDLTANTSGRIKMCLSSRPWAVFENAFEHTVPHLKLQELTYEDMRRYVEYRLTGDSRVNQLFTLNHQAGEQIIQETIQRADGVFLWVRLAVTKILEQLPNEGTIGDLQSALASLPTDLDILFDKFLFKDRSPAQIAKTADLFQLMRAREIVADFVQDESANSLTIWELAFALRTEDDAPNWSNLEVGEATDDEILERNEMTRAQIQARFAGLLDVFVKYTRGNIRVKTRTPDGALDVDMRTQVDSKVTYIHRTVRDYLMDNKDVFQRLTRSSSPDFDPHLRLLRSYVLRLNNPLEEVEHHRRLDEWWPDIALAMTHARHISHDPQKQQGPLVNELNRTLSWYWQRRSDDPDDTWARNAFASYEARMQATPVREPFLCLATKFGLVEYIRQELDVRVKTMQGSKLDSEHVIEGQRDDTKLPTPLLSYATEFLTSRQKTLYPLSSPELVSHLLNLANQTTPLLTDPGHVWNNSWLGALIVGPNSKYKSFLTKKETTPWLTLLRHLRDAHRRGWIAYYDLDSDGTSRWASIVQMFIQSGGADINAVVIADQWDPRNTALGIISLLEDRYGAAEVHKLKELMVAGGGSEE